LHRALWDAYYAYLIGIYPYYSPYGTLPDNSKADALSAIICLAPFASLKAPAGRAVRPATSSAADKKS
jgi:hypothetical protein